MTWRKAAIWICASAAGIAIGAYLAQHALHWRPRSVTIQGAVIRHDTDPRKQFPIADAAVTVSDGGTIATTQSDASGYFNLRFHAGVWPGRVLRLNFRAPGYRPLSLQLGTALRPAAQKLYVATLDPIPEPDAAQPGKPPSVVANIRVRYTVNVKVDEEIGSVVKIFQAVNQGNVPCNDRAPCSPDGRWKAATGSATLDAGTGNELRNIRASCIAGPCPFTQVELNRIGRQSRMATTTALDWSDTATFIVEAEVFHAATESSVRESYPVVFGRSLNFSLPSAQEGVSIEAEIDRQPIVFPLGPELYLSWATCRTHPSPDGTGSTVYLCELKPGFRF